MTSIPDVKDWVYHIEAKSLHFAAVAEYRKSLEELENSRSGKDPETFSLLLIFLFQIWLRDCSVV